MKSEEFDGSWILNVVVTDRQIKATLRVKGDLHIGGAMLKLVKSLEIAGDWSDHSFYWPDKSLWLTRARTTLDQYGVHADALLWFTPMHKNIQIQLPDLSVPLCNVNFSVNVFSVVIKLCKELGIRHPEELSLMRKLEPSELKRNQGVSGTKSSKRLPTGIHQTSMSASNPALDEIRTPGTSGYLTPEGTLSRGHHPFSTHSPAYHFNANGVQTPGSSSTLDLESYFPCPDQCLILPNILPKAKNLCELARLNSAWLDSSRSLMEQNINDTDLLLLRFKFLEFYDLNTKYDPARISHIYEQANWSIISEELPCSDDEIVMFAALQTQVEKQLKNQELESKYTDDVSEDEIDSALCDLQTSLEGHSEESPVDLTQTPQLKDWFRCYRPKKFRVKSFKRSLFLLKGSTLSICKRDDKNDENLLEKFELNGDEGFTVSSLCTVSDGKFLIKLNLPCNQLLIELWLRADSEEQYTKWLAALRLAQHGKTMADVKSYESEVKSIESLLNLQMRSKDCPQTDLDVGELNHLLPQRCLSRSKAKHLLQKVANLNSNMMKMSKIEAQVKYITAWQSLPLYGFRYFIVNLKNSKKEELLGIGTDRLVRIDIKKGDILKTWMYKTIKTWSVNWEIKQVQVTFEEEELAFQCLTAGCKVVHEFIGGYIFLSMRSGDKNQSLDEELFHKLTGGWA